jgi:signal transduction histidine kinase
VSPATWRAPDGRLWFSTIQGALVLSPQERKREASPPPVLIERVIVNGKPDEPYRGGRFGPGRENLEFQYTALSFLEPNRTTFRYLLEGFDNGWTDAGTRRQAFYTNLPPGAYRFRVMACSDGLCNEARNSNPVILVPYFYARPWFLLLCAGLTGLATWKVYQMRAQRWQEELALIVGERNRIARELHDTLIQGFSGITMQMQALAARLRSAEERATLKDIIVDAGNCLRETRRSVEGLRNRGGDGLASAIRGFAQPIAQERGIRLKLKLETSPHDLSAEAQYNLLRIAQEAITNAIKHSGARSIEIALGYSRNNLRLSVKDDGSGMDLDKDGGARSGHYGLIGMRERATDLGADLQVSSQPGKGTTVSVSMPLGKREHHSPQAQSREGERL